MINSNDIIKENIKGHNPNWPEITDHPYRILIIGGSGSGKTSSLFNPINKQPDIDKIYLYSKNPYNAKYQFLINKCILYGNIENTSQIKTKNIDHFWWYDSWCA